MTCPGDVRIALLYALHNLLDSLNEALRHLCTARLLVFVGYVLAVPNAPEDLFVSETLLSLKIPPLYRNKY